jgi:hypothetical protein
MFGEKYKFYEAVFEKNIRPNTAILSKEDEIFGS